MNRIPPSEKIQKQIDALLEGEWANGDELVTKLILQGAQHLGQEMLEQEVTDYLGRGHYERREESNENCGYRNTCCTQYSAAIDRQGWIRQKGGSNFRFPR